MATFQGRVYNWLIECFGEKVALDKNERCFRFLEESLELVQAAGCTKEDAAKLVDYVYGRKVGTVQKEVGDVLITLAALSEAHEVNMSLAGNTGLRRNWDNIDKIRAKHKSKPIRGPLPVDEKKIVHWYPGSDHGELSVEELLKLHANKFGADTWKECGERNGWLMPTAPLWKRLPIIRHVRALKDAVALKRHEDMYISMGLIPTGYDQWVLWGIFHGKERPKK